MKLYKKRLCKFTGDGSCDGDCVADLDAYIVLTIKEYFDGERVYKSLLDLMDNMPLGRYSFHYWLVAVKYKILAKMGVDIWPI